MDPVYNDPQPITVGGREFTCREIRYTVLRQRLREIAKITNEIKADWSTGAGFMAGIMGNLDQLFERADGLVAHLMQESTGISQEELAEMPASGYFELAAAVLEAQRPVVESFLAAKSRVATWVLPNTNTSSPSPASSRRSSAGGSRGVKSES